MTISIKGGCYCGALRYEAEGSPLMAAQCYCRECQYITGGGPNTFIAVSLKSFKYVKGDPASYTRTDLDRPVTRDFCRTCGTAIGTRPPGDRLMIVKVGTLDNPSEFVPTVCMHTADAQPFHLMPEGVAAFDRLPT
jgi:hypothetical protein